ncbi:MAG: hypothetical protein Q9217_006197 [Psora testacea]
MYTIFPAVQELSICLRFQYCSSVTKFPRALGSCRPLRRRNIRQFHSQRALRLEPTLGDVNRPDDIQRHQESHIGREYDGPVIRYEPVGSVTPAQRQARRDSLGVDVLGRPAEVIVLEQIQKEPYLRPIHAEGPDTNPKEWVSMSSSELMDAVSKERGIISADQVCENIEALRRSIQTESEETTGTVSDVAFDTLAWKLHRGFEAKQLQAYIHRTEREFLPDPIDLRKDYSCSSYARSSWRAGSTPISPARAPGILRDGRSEELKASTKAPTLRKGMKKGDLVAFIMRKCWQLTPRREGGVEGEVDLRLIPTHFDIILNHRRDIIKRTSESYGVKIEASRPQCIIRICSDFDACSDIIGLFKYIIDNIQHATPDVKALNGSIKEATIARTEKLTSTVIKLSEEPVSQSSSATKLDIYYLGPETTDLDDALRILTTAANPNGIQERTLLWAYEPDSDVLVSSLVDVDSSIPMADRHIQWSRWRTPVMAGNEVADLSKRDMKNILGEEVRKRKERALDNARLFLSEQSKTTTERNQYEVPPSIAKYWTPHLVSDTMATLGQVVFPTTTTHGAQLNLLKTASGNRSAEFEETMAQSRREFLTKIPGLLGSLRLLRTESENSESLYITLSPNPPPHSSPQLAKALPRMELRIGLTDSEQRVRMETARLIVEEKELDVLLPVDILDIRLSKQTSVYANAFDPALQAFVSLSNLDIWGNDRLTTPNSLSIMVPGHAIRSPNQRYGLKHFQDLQVDYVFTNLEHRSRLTTAYPPDAEINYTIIEAGRTRGRREELTLVLSQQALQNSVADRRWDPDSSLWSAANSLIARIRRATSTQF